MQRFSFLLFVFLFCFAYSYASKTAKLKLERTTIDLGVIYNTQSTHNIVIPFKNKGKQNLLISEVRSSCGCLTVQFPRDGFKPGDSGEIVVTLSTTHFVPQKFEKKIQIFSNSSASPQIVTIRGEYRFSE